MSAGRLNSGHHCARSGIGIALNFKLHDLPWWRQMPVINGGREESQGDEQIHGLGRFRISLLLEHVQLLTDGIENDLDEQVARSTATRQEKLFAFKMRTRRRT